MTAGRLSSPMGPTSTRPGRARGSNPLSHRTSVARDLSARAVIRAGHCCNLPLASTTYQRLCRSTVTNGALVTPNVFASRRF